ncbi:hypothetical protein KXX35_009807 [Aspergillus fumigatus]|nr:hypothetical protein KXX35_009807 [Aspergillus fumigatus]KAH2015163.1 hypothetical protein KXV97_005576 [Aspergillus fumigatus]KAH2889164.1 hypothetical protein KXW22_006451 [Aspergillus fumigatus]KAH3440678.1 hypothetical protein KXW39_009275 [Aspergillus fumigatus]KAH3504800.1 hypothetical protein KXW24_007736 [Aspergillus fumigatus]
MPFLRPIAETSGDAGSYEDGTEDAEGDDGGDSPAVVPFFQFSRFELPEVNDILPPGVTHEEHTFLGPDKNPLILSIFRKESPPDSFPQKRPAIYHIHGGGMIMGNRFCTLSGPLEFVREHDAICTTIEYRLAPKHPYPAPIEGCYAGLVWVHEHAEELGIDSTRIVINGLSAGGGLAAGVALLCRDRKGPPLIGQSLFSPMIDDCNDSVSAHEFTGTGIWDRNANMAGWNAYLGDRRGSYNVNVYAAPIRAKNLTGLPPAYIDVGSTETFRDEDVQYAQNMWRDGTQCELHRTGTSCVYPLRRKPRAPRVARANRSDTPSQDANLKHWTPQQNDTTIVNCRPTGLAVDVNNGMLSPAVNQLVSQPPLIHMSSDKDTSHGSPHFSLNPLEVLSPGFWDPEFTYGLPIFDLEFQQPSLQTNKGPDVPETHHADYNLLHDDSVTRHTAHQQFTPPLTDSLSVQAPQLQNIRDIFEQDTFRDLPHTLLDELQAGSILTIVDLWFDRVQSFLPLLHRPRFQSQFATDTGVTSSKYHGLGWEHRGDQFAQRAKAIYEASLPRLKAPTLVYLQGLITLAFYLYATEPDSQGWLLIGTCARLAYALELDKLDEDSEAVQAQMGLPEEWSMQEERRRAWWCIWELDAFAAAIACRRPTIDKKKHASHAEVMLPVSDEAWFSNIPVESAIIDPRPTHAWRTLENSRNQDPRSCWNPQYIGLHNPFMACLVVGPAAINLRVALDSKKEDAASSLTGLEVDLLILALKRVARFWNFGSILLGSNPKGAWQSGTNSMTHTFVFLKRYIPHRIMGISNCLCAGYTPC